MHKSSSRKAQAKTPVGSLREGLGLTYEAFGKKIGCSKGHAYQLTTGERGVSRRVARRLEEISGRPWHEWLAGPMRSAAE